MDGLALRVQGRDVSDGAKQEMNRIFSFEGKERDRKRKRV
jgi:hypothetical protein